MLHEGQRTKGDKREIELGHWIALGVLPAGICLMALSPFIFNEVYYVFPLLRIGVLLTLLGVVLLAITMGKGVQFVCAKCGSLIFDNLILRETIGRVSYFICPGCAKEMKTPNSEILASQLITVAT